jgi:hypothetical protein
MKLIVAGGRHYIFTTEDLEKLSQFHKDNSITEIVSGGATGADREGEKFALDMGIKIKKFPADWQKHGKAAGPIRNRQMAEYADAVMLFPGGRGTASMKNEAQKANIPVYDNR